MDNIGSSREVVVTICPSCGHDYSNDGMWSGFSHYTKGSDQADGFFRPVCDEGYKPNISPELQAAIDEISNRISNNLRKMIDDTITNGIQIF